MIMRVQSELLKFQVSQCHSPISTAPPPPRLPVVKLSGGGGGGGAKKGERGCRHILGILISSSKRSMQNNDWPR